MISDKLLSGYMQMIHSMKRMHFESFHEGMTRGNFMPMAILKRFSMMNPDMEGMYVSDLAKSLRVSSPAVSRMLKTLEEKNLVERTVDKNDRRNTFIRLTEYGNRMCEEKFRSFAEFHEKVFDQVGRQNVEQMVETWNKLQSAFDEEIKKQGLEMHDCCKKNKEENI